MKPIVRIVVFAAIAVIALASCATAPPDGGIDSAADSGQMPESTVIEESVGAEPAAKTEPAPGEAAKEAPSEKDESTEAASADGEVSSQRTGEVASEPEEASANVQPATESAEAEATPEIAAAEAQRAEVAIEDPAAEPVAPEPVIVHLLSRSERRLANGVLDSYTEYRYEDGTDRLASETTYLGSGELRGSKTYRYRPNGQVEIASLGSSGAIEATVIRTFDEDGNLIFEDQIDENNDPLVSSAYTYTDGVVTKWELIDADGELLSTAVYEYDVAGRKRSVATYDAEGTLQERIEYTYDRNGWLAAEKTIDAYDGTEIEKTAYAYDAAGNLLEYTRTGSGLYRKVVNDVDDGLVIRERVLGRREALMYETTFSYIAIEVTPEE